MYHDQKINLPFSLLQDYATVASKQFKMLKRIYENNLNNQLFPSINFPSKQNCLEIMAQGFGFDNYAHALKDYEITELRPFSMPKNTLRKLYYKLNRDIDERTGYYYQQWLSMCLNIFGNIFTLKHSTLCLYDEVNIAKFDNFGLIYEIFPFTKLVGNAIGEINDCTCEPEDSLFVLNILSLIVESKTAKFADTNSINRGVEEDSIEIRYRDLFRKRPKAKGHKHLAMDYVTDGLFDSGFAIFLMQYINTENDMDTSYTITLTNMVFKGLQLAKQNQINIEVCKAVLNQLILENWDTFGLKSIEELNVGQSQRYLEIYRKALVATKCLIIDEHTEWLMLPESNIYKGMTKSCIEKRIGGILKTREFIENAIEMLC